MKLPKDKLKWVAAAFALVATASAEYSLARAIGMNEWIAAAVPGALDAYAVRALRAHREVLTAVLAMVGVNAASHLVTAGVLPVSWPLITAVSAIAPLVLWRVHALSTPGEHRRRALWGVPEPLADVPPVPEHGCSCSVNHSGLCPYCTAIEAQQMAWRAQYEHEEQGTEPATVPFEEHASTAPGVLDYVPEEWTQGPDTEHERDQVADVLPLPEGFTRKERAPSLPFPESLAKARELFPTGVPTVRGIKAQVGTGTRTAQRIREELAKERGGTP